MGKSVRKEACCQAPAEEMKVEAIISVDDRGQMVLPKEIREKFGLRPGDKLAVVTKERDGKLCCLYMFRAEELMNAAKDKIGPLLTDDGKR